jgi:uncharacterized protein YukE
MTTLDDVYEQMRLFEKALRDFNETVRVSAAELSKLDADTRALWRDEASRRYGQAYDPLAQMLDEYLKSDAPRFEQFLDRKVQQLARYLHGAA